VGGRLRVVVTVANSAGTISAESQTSDIVSGSSPAPKAKPRVTGALTDGATVTADPGTWTGDGPFDYGYQWQRCLGSTCKPIKDAAAKTYTLTAEDVGQRIAVKVTAANVYGKADATSTASDAVVAVRPVNVKRPTVSRLPSQLETGLVLKGRDGTWKGSAPITFSYQWLRCTTAGRKCRMVKRETKSTYTLKKRDLKGSKLKYALVLAVTASNAGGDRTALSKAVGVKKKPLPARVTFSKPVLKGAVLTVRVTCLNGSAACDGRVMSAGATATVSIPAGSTQKVSLSITRSVAKHVRLRFIPASRAAGRRVSVKLTVKRR
jgi:hypothetical protein